MEIEDADHLFWAPLRHDVGIVVFFMSSIMKQTLLLSGVNLLKRAIFRLSAK